MEHSQLSQMVSWLDKEHQRDRSELHQLQQRVQTLVGEKEEQAKRIMDLEAELTTLHAKLSGQLKSKGTLALQARNQRVVGEKRSPAPADSKDSDRCAQVEIENVTQAVTTSVRKPKSCAARRGIGSPTYRRTTPDGIAGSTTTASVGRSQGSRRTSAQHRLPGRTASPG